MGNLAEQPHSHPVLAELDLLLQRYRQVRATSEAICTPLQVEDYVIQSTPEVTRRNGTWRTSAGSSRPFCYCLICLVTGG